MSTVLLENRREVYEHRQEKSASTPSSDTGIVPECKSKTKWQTGSRNSSIYMGVMAEEHACTYCGRDHKWDLLVIECVHVVEVDWKRGLECRG